MDNSNIYEAEHTLPIQSLIDGVKESFSCFGWHGFLIANFGEGYGDQDMRSERIGGLSITYNPDFRQSDITLTVRH